MTTARVGEELPRHEPSSSVDLHVTVTETLGSGDQRVLWEVVQQGFADLNRRSYEKQDMTREEFAADMANPRVLKCVVRSGSQPIGVMLMHRGLDAITWCDTAACQSAQDAVDPKGMPHYISTLVVPPDQRGTGAARELLRGVGERLVDEVDGGHTSLCFFDCADANYPWLAEFTQSVYDELAEESGFTVAINEIGCEEYVRVDGRVTKSLSGTLAGEVVDRQHMYALRVVRTR